MKKSTQIILLIVALLILVFSGSFYMKEQQRKEELKRNREYEVSLVKALKNSYENIEEIKITHPVSTEMPGDWNCTVRILFNDKKSIKYSLTHNKDSKKNYSGSLNETEMDFLEDRTGTTHNTVKVIFSNGQEKFE
ncbi:hypothetical protein SaSA201_0300 [Streptococcus agalactiae]|nr:hypothetical protein SaSA20_0211 [Streptococcus agalactiae]AHN30014.1 hypothetical protein V193_02150 [Streptococcus agalactiae 138P]AHX74557.1 hypothetical protein DN94_02150 [Streptococcus agalactiae]AKU01333.1 hypothetical protein GX026_02205 [Streptococcus agalactiae]ANI26722.1 hypothetical protein A9J19_01335 [Streptococcus agalactiae]